MKYSAFIFDFDYTLGDSTKGIVESINYAFKKMGLSCHSEENIRKTVGMTMQNAFKHLAGNNDEELAETFYRLFMERADAVMTQGTTLYKDTIPLLTSIKSKGLKTAIVTTKHHKRIDQILKKYEINSLVDVIVGSNDVSLPKPHPQSLFMAAELLGILPGEAVFTGDSVIDAKAAMAAGMDFFGVTTGTTLESELSAYPNIGVGKGINELNKFLDN